MVEIKLQDILNEHERSLRWVSSKTGISYSALHKLNSGNTNSISFEVLEKICTLFNIKPNDLLNITSSTKELNQQK